MNRNKEPKFWVTVLKLVLGAIGLILFFGLGLYYTAEFNTYAPDVPATDNSWGLSKDNPIRSLR